MSSFDDPELARALYPKSPAPPSEAPAPPMSAEAEAFYPAAAADARLIADAHADPALTDGGFDANLAVARQAVRDHGDAELRQLLDETRLGNHPAMVRFVARVGRALAGQPAAKPQQPPADDAQRFHGKGARGPAPRAPAADPGDDDAAIARKFYPRSS